VRENFHPIYPLRKDMNLALAVGCGIRAGMAQAVGNAPPLSLTIVMGLTCCAVGLVLGILALGFLVSLRSKDVTESEPYPTETNENDPKHVGASDGRHAGPSPKV
jgi:Na+/glutamate symporter